MASESSDSDVRSFGSEPDFAAMGDLVIDDDPGPSSSHVFYEINDDSPREFGHDLEIKGGERLREAFETFDDAVYGDGELGSRDLDVTPTPESNPSDVPTKPKRVHADRQTTRPVVVQAREWRMSAPHLRVRGRASFPSTSRTETVDDPSTLEGVQIVPGPIDGTPQESSNVPGSIPNDDDAPWRTNEAEQNLQPEWWGQTPVLAVLGEKATLYSETETDKVDLAEMNVDGSVHTDTSPATTPTQPEEIFAVDGDIIETYADDTRRRDGETNSYGESLAAASTNARETRRRAVSLPSVDPRVVLALDHAFFRGDVNAGGVEPVPAGLLSGATTRSTVIDDEEDEDVDELEFKSETDPTENEYYENSGDRHTAPPNPWPGKTQWEHKDGDADSGSEWSAADSGELRRWEA